MGINNWPESERPREKLLNRGADNLSDAELLAIFLRTGIKGKSAVDLARELLISFGSLRALLTAGKEEFCQHLGLGQPNTHNYKPCLKWLEGILKNNCTAVTP